MELAHRRGRRAQRGEHPRGDALMDLSGLGGDPGGGISGETAESPQLITPH
jgi:hypothetical protein